MLSDGREDIEPSSGVVPVPSPWTINPAVEIACHSYYSLLSTLSAMRRGSAKQIAEGNTKTPGNVDVDAGNCLPMQPFLGRRIR